MTHYTVLSDKEMKIDDKSVADLRRKAGLLNVYRLIRNY